MAFVQKNWKNREVEYPGRRKLAPTGTENVVDVTREEGLVLEEGDTLDAASFNNLEQRVGAGFETTCTFVYTATLLLDGWAGDATAGWTQTVAITSVDGGPAVTAGTQLLGPMALPTGVRATDEALAEVLRIVNDGTAATGARTVTCKVWELPKADAKIYWPGKVGAE